MAISGKTSQQQHGFTLVELLVVIGIIALLVSILLPSLSRTREQANSIKCLSNLRSIGQGFVLYNNQNKGYNVPSYNMPTGKTTFATGDIADGWACILDRDGLVNAGEKTDNTIYNCPSADLNTNTNKSSVLWPNSKPGGADATATTYPARGFLKILRVGYWINAENPTGRTDYPAITRMYYTASPGYRPTAGPAAGVTMGLQKITKVRHSPALIVVVDGIYAGRQGDVRNTDPKCRIGYRHKASGKLSANAAFADGHAESMFNDNFPRAYDDQADNVDAKTMTIPRLENLGEKPTLYSNPEETLQ